MQKIKMSGGALLTFEEGCNKDLENCRQRNLCETPVKRSKQLKFHQEITGFLFIGNLYMGSYPVTSQKEGAYCAPSFWPPQRESEPLFHPTSG